MSRNWSFYDRETGLFRQKRVTCPDNFDIRSKTPDGCCAIEGTFDPLSQRVVMSEPVYGDGIDGLSQPVVVDWQPPRPSEDHEWDADRRRWVLRPSVAERRSRKGAAESRSAEVDRKSIRALREAVIALLPEGDPVRARLLEHEAEIAPLRPDMR
jgi:hypothetical protein